MQIDREVHSGRDDSCLVQITAATGREGCDRVKAIQRQGVAIHTKTVVRIAGPKAKIALYTVFTGYQETPGIDPKTDEPGGPEPVHLYFAVRVEILSGLS